MRIKQLGDPLLREKSLPITPEHFASGEVSRILDQMRSVLNGIKAISDENGNALSSPQVGHLLRIVLLRLDGEFVPMINPQFESTDGDTFMFEEECFSMYQLRGSVERFSSVDVSFLNEQGEPQSRLLEGENAGLIQHEIDHLDGILFLDRLANGRTPRTIDYELRDNPERLAQVKQMLEYMVTA